MNASREKIPGYVEDNGKQVGVFWTLCPFCYYLYEYELIYVNYCLTCQNCRKPFHGVAVVPPPPGCLVEGEDPYYLRYGMNYDFGTSSNYMKGENVGVRASSLSEKKGNLKTELEDVVLISDDDCDGDYEIGGKDECKKEKNSNVEKETETGGENEDDVLQRSLGTDDEIRMKRKRKMNVKVVAKNTKKKMGRGISYTTVDAEFKQVREESQAGRTESEEEGVSEPENTGRIESEEEKGIFEDYLDYAALESTYVDLGIESIS